MKFMPKFTLERESQRSESKSMFDPVVRAEFLGWRIVFACWGVWLWRPGIDRQWWVWREMQFIERCMVLDLRSYHADEEMCERYRHLLWRYWLRYGVWRGFTPLELKFLRRPLQTAARLYAASQEIDSLCRTAMDLHNIAADEGATGEQLQRAVDRLDKMKAKIRSLESSLRPLT